MIAPDAPLLLKLEMYAVVGGVPVLVLLAMTAILALLRPWRFSSGGEAVWKMTKGVGIVGVAVLLGSGAFLLGFGQILEDPRYRAHFICEPCF